MRFGVVGTGHWAAEVHARALAGHPRAELVGVWGRDEGRAAQLADRFAVRAYPDPDRMFDDVDAVAFAVPPDVQAPLAVLAAQRGKHLLLDKPTALDLATADRLAAEVAAAGVRSAVFFTLRFTPNIADWLTGAATADEWLSARVRICGDIFQPGNPFGGSPWRRERGGLWDVGPHALSVLLPLLGPVDRVVAERGVGDTVEVVTHHASGATALLTVALDAPPGSAVSSWQLYGRRTHAELPEPAVPPLDAMTACIDALLDDRAHGCDATFGRDVVAVLAAAQEFLDRPAELRAVRVR